MKDDEAEKHALLVLEKYNEQKQRNKGTTKENTFKAVVHQVYTELKKDPTFFIDETDFFREVTKQCHILQPKKRCFNTEKEWAKEKEEERRKYLRPGVYDYERTVYEELERGADPDFLSDIGILVT